MKCSELGYNNFVNPFTSRAVDVFNNFVYIVSATIIGERERANLVLQLGRGVVIYIYICYIVRRRRAPGVYDVNIP